MSMSRLCQRITRFSSCCPTPNTKFIDKIQCNRLISLLATNENGNCGRHQHSDLNYLKYPRKKSLLQPYSVQVTPHSPLYSLVEPMTVSKHREVPDHIKKPSYAVNGVVPEAKTSIPLKTRKQIEGITSACKLARDILQQAGNAVRVGMTTDEIDELVHKEAVEKNAYPSPLLYRGFPKSVCTSVNNVACHGIPDSRPLQDGDIVNIDVTVYLNGYHGDCSKTYLVGNVNEQGRYLVDVAEQCRDAGIDVCKPGARFCDIGNAISDVAHRAGMSVIPQFCGHGVGENFHELPDIYHFEHYDDKLMKPGMVFTVEPVICDGHPDIRILPDGWTAVTCDNSRSAQFEHTILITNEGVEILTS